jgi:hypothetical protein
VCKKCGKTAHNWYEREIIEEYCGCGYGQPEDMALCSACGGTGYITVVIRECVRCGKQE